MEQLGSVVCHSSHICVCVCVCGCMQACVPDCSRSQSCACMRMWACAHVWLLVAAKNDNYTVTATQWIIYDV